jgi:hypothetical protein
MEERYVSYFFHSQFCQQLIESFAFDSCDSFFFLFSFQEQSYQTVRRKLHFKSSLVKPAGSVSSNAEQSAINVRNPIKCDRMRASAAFCTGKASGTCPSNTCLLFSLLFLFYWINSYFLRIFPALAFVLKIWPQNKEAKQLLLVKNLSLSIHLKKI